MYSRIQYTARATNDSASPLYGNYKSSTSESYTADRVASSGGAQYDHYAKHATKLYPQQLHSHSAMAPHRATTPIRGTTPVRCVTPIRTWRSTASATPSASASPASSTSSFMTQAKRGEQSTPKTQVIRQNTFSAHANTAPERRRESLLPPMSIHDRRMLLVLDMDETLLHAEVTPTQHDVSFAVVTDNGASTPVYVKFRPYLSRFLNTVSRLFEVVVFTASISRYANQVLDFIDPKGELVHHRLFREHCTNVNGSYVKDLDRLGRPAKRVAIVDNSPAAYTLHPGNAIAIPSWYECQEDQALHHLIPHLTRMAQQDTVYESLDDIRCALKWD